jgi:hypothetical protein
MTVDGNKCTNKQPTTQKRWGINQGNTINITITQSVSDTMLKRIMGAAHKEVLKFDLSHMTLHLETTTKVYKGRNINIKFGSYDIIPKENIPNVP